MSQQRVRQHDKADQSKEKFCVFGVLQWFNGKKQSKYIKFVARKERIKAILFKNTVLFAFRMNVLCCWYRTCEHETAGNVRV